MRVETSYSKAPYSVQHGLVTELHIQTIKCFVEQVSFKSGLERINRSSLIHAEG